MLLLLIALAGANAQQGEAPPQTGTVQETIDVQIVNLEVRVTDRQGAPITGLRAADFVVLENGTKVEPTNFLEVPGVARPEETTSLVLYIDSHNMRSASRDLALSEFEAELPALLEGDRLQAMVVSYDTKLEVIQRFSSDWSDIGRALARLRGRAAVGDDRDAFRRSTQLSATEAFRKSRGTDRLDRQNAALSIDALLGEMKSYAKQLYADTEGSLRALSTLVRSLGWLQGPKVVVYLSDGLAARPLDGFITQMVNVMSGSASTAGDLVESRSGGQAATAPGAGGIFSRDGSMEFGRFQQTIEPFRSSSSIDALVAEANTYGVTLFAAKPPPGDAEAAARRSKGRGSLIELSDLRAAMHLFGEGTGGAARTTGSSLAGFLPKALSSLAQHHYSLGLSAAGKTEGEYTEIEVRVKKRGSRVSYRDGYVKKGISTRIFERALSALVLGESDNPHLLEAHIEAMTPAEGGEFDVQLRVEVPIGKLRLVEQGGVHAANARLVVIAMAEDDQLTVAQHLGFQLEVPAESLQDALGSHHRSAIQLRLPAGKQRIALGLWDAAAGAGSVLTDTLTVGTLE